MRSQLQLHTLHGGILPPVASDLHERHIEDVVKEALASSVDENGTCSIDAVAVTTKPGMAASLLVGLRHAKQVCQRLGVPLVPIHHMEAHALTLEFPFLVLLISGGHCLLGIAEGVDKFVLLGKTLDDAPGEAFDKIARRLKLSNLAEFSNVSGGHAIEGAAAGGDPSRYHVAEPLLQYKNCDFSFAGIKNSTRAIIIAEENRDGVVGDELLKGVRDLCASVQVAIARHLLRRVIRGIFYYRHQQSFIKSLYFKVVSGGVACNSFIRRSLETGCGPLGVELVAPPPRLCTDNGVMVAWNGVERWSRNLGIVPLEKLQVVDIQPK
ncbi:hypothetical protein AAG570_000765 [Ranatra chinensis]|uniref:N(6)-L-threonylcarbamoyladenine synthase n=1 Tax=Ranatra chinensis TaxID=642074 RepID=A0ABD0YY24_9HEMI